MRRFVMPNANRRVDRLALRMLRTVHYVALAASWTAVPNHFAIHPEPTSNLSAVSYCVDTVERGGAALPETGSVASVIAEWLYVGIFSSWPVVIMTGAVGLGLASRKWLAERAERRALRPQRVKVRRHARP